MENGQASRENPNQEVWDMAEGAELNPVYLGHLVNLAINMKRNVEARSRAPQWLIENLREIFGDDFEPGSKYGSNPTYLRGVK